MKKNINKPLKHIFILLIICIFGFTAAFVINFYIKHSVQNRISTSPAFANADCILILGAGVKNGYPTNMLEDRLLTGIHLYEKGVSDKIIMSGDHGRDEYDEVNVMKQYAVARNIPSENIFMDHAGFSTYDSIYRARDIFTAERIIIVSQEYHLYRALYIADKLGVEAYGVPADLRNYYGQNYRDAREFAARIKDFFYTLFKPKPTYLGDTIPVSGNGNITND